MIGFEQVAVLQDHLLGPDGRRHDLILLVLQLTE
jgi:hypothetical protein